jgi:hypothetical protein
MLVRMSTASVASDAGTLGGVATRLSTAASTLVSSLNGCAGMAGIDPMAEEFAQGAEQEGGYDRSAQAMAQSGITLARAVAGLEQYVLGLSAAYRAMELAGADGGANPYQNLTATTVSAYCPAISTALGDEHRGTAGGEIMEWIENFLKDTAGIVIPTASTDKVRTAASAWDSYEAALASASASVSAALPVTLSAEFPQHDSVLAVRDRLAELIDGAATDAGKLAEGCRSYAANVDSIREELLAMLGQLALEVAIDIGVGVALSFFSFGAGALAGMAKAAATVARWIPKIVSVINRLKTLIRASKRLMALMRRAAIEAIESTVSGTIANAGASIAFGNFSWSNLGGAAVSSGIGGMFTGPFSHIGASSTSRVVRVTTQGGVQGVTGGVGGVVGEWTASQLTGQDFNLVMSALVGSVGGTVSGGVSGIGSPSGAGGGAGAPSTDVPTIGGTGGAGGTGGSGSAGGSGGGSSATPPTTVDGPAPGGGAPASTNAGSGGGSNVPQSDAPTATGGSGGSGGSANSGGSAPVDPSGTPVDVPSSLPSDAPAAVDAPGGADTGSGTPDTATSDPTGADTPSPATTDTPPPGGDTSPSAGDSTTPTAGDATSGDQGPTAAAGAGTAAGVGSIPTVDLPDSLGAGAGGGVPPVGGGRGPSDPGDTPIFHETEDALGIDYDDLVDDLDNALDGARDSVDGGDGTTDGPDGDGGADGADADDAAVPPASPTDPAGDDIPPAAVRDEILATPKGERPDPATYLPADYIETHLGRFDGGATRFMTQSNLDKYGIGQRDGTAFVMPRSEVDALIERTGGDPRAMEDALGLPEGFFDNGAVRVDIDIDGADPHGLRMPSGNEAGANDLWVPGGRLPGGFSEAVIDAGDVPPGDVHVTPMGGSAARSGADPASPDAPAGRGPSAGAGLDPRSAPDPASPADPPGAADPAGETDVPVRDDGQPAPSDVAGAAEAGAAPEAATATEPPVDVGQRLTPEQRAEIAENGYYVALFDRTQFREY